MPVRNAAHIASNSVAADENTLPQPSSASSSLVHVIPQQVWTARPDGHLDFVNEVVLRYFGRTYEEMIGEGWQGSIHPEDLPACIARWTHALETGTPYEVEFRLRRADGVYRWHLGRALPEHNADGQVAKWYGTNTDIHNHKVLLDGILRNSKDGIMALKAVRDEDGEILDFTWLMTNPAASHLTHRPDRDLVGLRLLEEAPVLRRIGIFDAFKQVVETDTPYKEEKYYADRHIQGWFDITVVKLGDGVAVTFRNITERKQAEEVLARSERLLNRAQAIAHIGSWKWNIEQGTLLWSDELYRIYGMDPEEGDITFDAYMACLHPEDRDRVQGIVAAAMESKEPFSFYHRIVRPDGEERILRGDGEVVTNEAGTPIKMFGTAHDVTEQKTAERELAQSKQLLDGILNNAPDGIMALEAIRDEDGVIIDFRWLLVNPAATRITHRDPDFHQGKRMLEVLPELRGSGMIDDFKTIVEEDVSLYREQYYERDDMQGWFASTMVKLDDGLVVIFRDITERKASEQEMERINARLKQRNRELQDFAYVASHDLQEPLRKIRAFADLLEEDYAEKIDENGQYYLSRMRDAASRMSRLITDLLAYSRVSTKARPFDEVDLNMIAREVISDLELQISEIEASVDIGPLPTIQADPTQMHQLLQNLIGNALKFTRDDVRPIVTVAAALENEDDPDEAVCQLTVSDNGIGFDEKYLDRIFTPFQRLHGRGTYAGTGMGLAICRRIAERHQGSLTAQSTPGEGATFIATLPLQQPSQQPEHTPV